MEVANDKLQVNWNGAAHHVSHHALEIFKTCHSCSQMLFTIQNKASHKT